MAIDFDMIEALVAAGSTGAQIAAAVRVMEAKTKVDGRRSAGRTRQRRYREAQSELPLIHPPEVKEKGERVCEILRAMPPQPDNATELHDAVEVALEIRGVEVQRECPIEMNDGRKGYIDLVAEGCVAIELDRRLPRAKSLKKLAAFPGYRIAVTRTDDASLEFEAMVDAVVAIPPISDADVTAGNADVTAGDVFKERKVSIPSKERTTTSKIDDDEDLRATPQKQSLVSLEAYDLADSLGSLAGLEPKSWPPGWCGAAMTIQRFLNEGVPPDVISLAVTTALARKRDGPSPDIPANFAYFCKPIAQEFARYRTPLPQIQPGKLEVIDGGLARSPTGKLGRFAAGRAVSQGYGSATDAAIARRNELAREAERLESIDAAISSADCRAYRDHDGGPSS